MRNVHHCHAKTFVNVFDLVLHLFPQLFIQRAEGFIHQHEVRIKDQSTGHGHTLLLTAGKLGGPSITKGTQLNHVERPLGAGCDFGLAELANLQRKRKIFVNCHMREKGIVLKYHADASFVRRHRIDRTITKINLTMGSGLKSRQHHETSSLARPGGSQHGDKLAAFDIQVEILDD